MSGKITIKGKVVSCNRGIYTVEFDGKDNNKQQIRAKLSGKIHYNKINVYENDIVTVELSPYDLSQGVITFRHLERKSYNETYED